MKLGAGELRVQGRQGEDRREPRRDGFFTVGDVGYLDEDGFLFLCDRKSDMIISGGVNIYPAEIEGEILAHPKVGDVAVFGIPDDDWGEEIKAVVEPAAGSRAASDELAEELLAYAATRLGRFKWPKSSTSSTRCRAIPTASSTSASCATRTGKGAAPRPERRTRRQVMGGVATTRRAVEDEAAISTSSPTWSMPDQPLTQPISAENQTWPSVRVICGLERGVEVVAEGAGQDAGHGAADLLLARGRARGRATRWR